MFIFFVKNSSTEKVHFETKLGRLHSNEIGTKAIISKHGSQPCDFKTRVGLFSCKIGDKSHNTPGLGFDIHIYIYIYILYIFGAICLI